MIAENWFSWIIWAGLLCFALLSQTLGEIYWVTLATRAAIFAIAGIGLNFALGNGGMISFGHAAYFGLGGYVVGILATHAQTYS